MKAFGDFAVSYDPSKDTLKDVTKRIFYSLFIRRIKGHKPCIIFLSGDSGEGKSLAGIKIQEVCSELQGIDLAENNYKNFEVMNVYMPLEYPEKLDKLLYDKEYKKTNMICIHDAREVINSKQWYSFLNQSIASVNALSRSVKRLIVIVISQFIRDISNDIRYTLNYYIKVSRPIGHKARLYINVLWKDDTDLDKPKLKKRRLMGYLVYPNGEYRKFVPEYLELDKPDEKLIEIFEKRDYEGKSKIIKTKIDRLIKEMKDDIGFQSNKINLMSDWYYKHPENLNIIAKRIKNKWRVNSNFKDMHDLSDIEAREFESQINEKFKEVKTDGLGTGE